MKQIDDFIANAEFLPPAFQLLPRLLLLLEDVESNVEALAELIRVDPGLTADILRVCNSAKYSLGYRAESIPEAILRMGFEEVQRIMMTVIASPVLKDPQSAYASKQGDLWNHSLAAAVASESLAPIAGINTDLVFTAALLHDIGKVVLAQAVPEQVAAASAVALEKNQPLYLAERSILKTDHAGIGARLLDRWGFPKRMTIAIRHHHEPAGARDEVRLASCLCLSNVLAYRVENGIHLPEYVRYPDTRALKELNLTQPELEALVPEAQERFIAAQKRFE
ncbi:MAG TPA: HDOD domain-containing protein [Candidatus Kapabacteria bacterium]|nr:HDOD domain-containing protein [Candidatus Kapabacteria bacterium]